VNLISSTANSEANIDEKGDNLFDITSLTEHYQQKVSKINDPVLWNCRETSVTKNYYKFLYGMLFVVTGTATLAFFVIKTLNFCGTTPLKHLWEVAVAQYLKEELNDKRNLPKEQADQVTKCYQDAFNKDVRKSNITKCYKCLRTLTSMLSIFCLIVGWWFLLLSYDLHPVSCLSGPDENTIHYIADKSEVQIRFLKQWLNFQIAAVIIGFILLGMAILNSLIFYVINNLIISEMKEITKGICDPHKYINPISAIN